MINKYIPINDGYGIIGYKFECSMCGTLNKRMVDEEEINHTCSECDYVNTFEPILD